MLLGSPYFQSRRGNCFGNGISYCHTLSFFGHFHTCIFTTLEYFTYPTTCGFKLNSFPYQPNNSNLWHNLHVPSLTRDMPSSSSCLPSNSGHRDDQCFTSPSHLATPFSSIMFEIQASLPQVRAIRLYFMVASSR